MLTLLALDCGWVITIWVALRATVFGRAVLSRARSYRARSEIGETTSEEHTGGIPRGGARGDPQPGDPTVFCRRLVLSSPGHAISGASWG